MQWHFLGEALPRPPHRDVFLSQMVKAGLLRQIPELANALQCNGLQRCTQVGIWESRVGPDHPSAMLYNRWDQQSYVEIDQPFPDPRGRSLEISMADLRWVYLGGANENTENSSVQKIAL